MSSLIKMGHGSSCVVIMIPTKKIGDRQHSVYLSNILKSTKRQIEIMHRSHSITHYRFMLQFFSRVMGRNVATQLPSAPQVTNGIRVHHLILRATSANLVYRQILNRIMVGRECYAIIHHVWKNYSMALTHPVVVVWSFSNNGTRPCRFI